MAKEPVQSADELEPIADEEEFEDEEGQPLGTEDDSDAENSGGRVFEYIKTNRRSFILGTIGAAVLSAIYIGNELARDPDTKLGKSLRCVDTYLNINSLQGEIDQAQQTFNEDPVAVMTIPKDFTDQLNEMTAKISTLIKFVEKIDYNGIKINSGYIYLQQKKIQAALARFTNENFSSVFHLLGKDRGVAGLINNGGGKDKRAIPITVGKIPRVIVIGVPLKDIVADFLKKQSAQKPGIWTEKTLTLGEVSIPLRSLDYLAESAQNLIKSLVMLQSTIARISAPPNIELSNDDGVSYNLGYGLKDGRPNSSRRLEFTHGLSEILEIDKAHPDGKFGEDEIKTIQGFLVRYAYLVQMGVDDPVNGIYDASTKDAFDRLKKIHANALKFKKEYRESLKKGVKSPVIAATEPEVNDVQDMVALAGYLGPEVVKSAYGKETFDAAVRWGKDWDKYSK